MAPMDILEKMSDVGDMMNNWHEYKNRFLSYVQTHYQNLDDSAKIVLLINFATDNCQRIYQTFEYGEDEDKNDLATLLFKFDYHFSSEMSVAYERYLFFGRKQRDCETYNEYIEALLRLSDSCQFSDLKESLIVDQFIRGVRDIKLKRKLFTSNHTDIMTLLFYCNMSGSDIKTDTSNILLDSMRPPIQLQMDQDGLSDVYIKVEMESDEDIDHDQNLTVYDDHHRSLEKSSSGSNEKPTDSSANSNSKEQNKKPHIKKPLNAFMLYMKEMRAKVVAECTLKESAAINQILGRRWHSLSREEQAKYYEKARQERQLHMQLYPGWSARDNYGYGSKKKKRKKDRSPAELGGNNLKKCRARYGLDQQNQWCKPCRRKKKCVRYMEALAAASGSVGMPMATPQSPCSDEDIKLEELSDASSDGEADTPLNSASSPGGLSALSSLASPASDPPPAAPHRNPVGTNPRDANNPLSVGQLTSQTWPRSAQPRSGHEVISVS